MIMKKRGGAKVGDKTSRRPGTGLDELRRGLKAGLNLTECLNRQHLKPLKGLKIPKPLIIHMLQYWQSRLD